MKKILTIIAILTVLAGCSDPFSAPPKLSPQLPDGTGAVHITLNGSARTAMPVQFNVSRLYYVLTFTSNSNGEEIRKTFNRQSSFTVELPTDDWNLDVKGFASTSDAAEGENVLVHGSTNNILVAPSPIEIPTVNVVLTPNESNMTQTQTGRGVLLYDITLPAGASGTITAYSLDGEQKPFYTLNSTTSANSITLSASSYSGTREMVSGFYLISITARLNNKDRVWRELAQIYDNAITELEHEFTADDIINDTTAAIASFSFALSRGYYPINTTDKTINVIVPPDTDVTALSPVINYSGVMIKPAPEEPQDFTEPVVYTVYPENGAQTSYTVTVTDTITSTELLNSYLQNPSDNIDTPVPVKVSINLANSNGGWSSLLSVLNSRNSYVALDLSGSTGMTTFNPNTSNTGKNRIVSLILPVSTTGITNGSSITDFPFSYFSSLKSITGVNVRTLGTYSFYGLTGLESADFPALTAIADYAFRGCTGLTGVTIPDSVTSIGSSAFYNCAGVTGVIPDGVTGIGNYAFYNCTGITGVIPDGVTSIGSYAFYGCTGITGVIPGSVTSIGTYAFYNCTGITSVTIGNGITSIGERVFYGCTGLASVTIGNSVTSIGSSAFYGCTGLTSITIPASVTSIGSSAFGNCANLTVTIQTGNITTTLTSNWGTIFSNNTALSVIFGNGITSIGNYAFYNCTGLTGVNIGNNVASIGSSAFSGCTGLTSITIPASVTSIGSSAFGYCANLTVTIQTGNITTTQTSNWGTIFSGNTALVVIFGNGVTSIGQQAFYNCTGLTGVAIGNSVISIGGWAFMGCTGLTGVAIGNSVTSIENDAFYNCTGLTGVTIPDSVISIGSFAFSGCTGLTSVTFNGSITSTNFASGTPFPGDLRAKYLDAGGSIGTYTTTSPGSNAVWTKLIGVVSITAPIWRDGNPISLAAPPVSLPAGNTVTAQGWQISDDGSSGWVNFTSTTADMSYNGKYLRYYATSSGGQTYNSNTVQITVFTREVTIAMWDSYGDGWNNSAALRININGTDRPNYASISTTPSGQRSTYTFVVNSGDVVQIYWVSGGQYDMECAFAVYYSDDPPSPAFSPATDAAVDSGRLLVYRQYRPSGSAAFGNGTLMGSFTVP
jgi:hypothetical protein